MVLLLVANVCLGSSKRSNFCLVSLLAVSSTCWSLNLWPVLRRAGPSISLVAVANPGNSICSCAGWVSESEILNDLQNFDIFHKLSNGWVRLFLWALPLLFCGRRFGARLRLNLKHWVSEVLPSRNTQTGNCTQIVNVISLLVLWLSVCFCAL